MDTHPSIEHQIAELNLAWTAVRQEVRVLEGRLASAKCDEEGLAIKSEIEKLSRRADAFPQEIERLQRLRKVHE